MFGNKRRKAKARAEKDNSSLGRILLDLGYCDTDTLDKALAGQLDDMPRLGQILVSSDVITADQLEHALTRQRVLRGEIEPSELMRFGANKRREALGELTTRLRAVAESAGILATKMRG
jgi:hypothetical protein